MESDTVERVTEWDSEPFTDGYAGLREFAGAEFSGAVTDGSAWLFMLNGRVLGVFGGNLDQFDGADGTAYDAPDQSLPLLFAMQETGGEERGEYYTEETPLDEVDRTLQSGNFTGYVELSENVLSGDYYLTYYGGRQLPVAFVGNQERRLTGDDAYERAADEVGIYRVKTVDLEITDVPEPETDDSTAAATAASDDQSASTADTEASTAGSEASTVEADSSTPEPEPSPSEIDSSTFEADTSSVESEPTEPESDPSTAKTQNDESDGSPPAGGDVDTGTAEAATSTEEDGTATPSTPREDGSQAGGGGTASSSQPMGTDSAADETDTGPETTDVAPGTTDAAAGSEGSTTRFDAESEWRGSKTIPALDPEESVSMDAPEPPEGTTTGADNSEEVAALQDERDRLRARVEELETETERLSGERDRLEEERDEAATTAEELEAELAELRATVDELESELETAEADLAAAKEYVPEGDHELTPEEAMAGTSLFVRYERKGGPTLEDAHQGDADRETVNDNVRLEHHTEFDDDGAVVDGEPFDEWLRGTIEYGFVEWVIRTFVHDVRETRNQTSMRKLFDAIPAIDRVEFSGTIDFDEETEEESASFGVVLRDRMGQPLIVTDLNDSRDPATEPMLESLIRNATPVAEANESVAAAFFVTSSYYEPDALETAEDATGGGFLSRDRSKSFVRLSRKDGYHVCLVETRESEFHVSVPEL